MKLLIELTAKFYSFFYNYYFRSNGYFAYNKLIVPFKYEFNFIN